MLREAFESFHFGHFACICFMPIFYFAALEGRREGNRESERKQTDDAKPPLQLNRFNHQTARKPPRQPASVAAAAAALPAVAGSSASAAAAQRQRHTLLSQSSNVDKQGHCQHQQCRSNSIIRKSRSIGAAATPAALYM